MSSLLIIRYCHLFYEETLHYCSHFHLKNSIIDSSCTILFIISKINDILNMAATILFTFCNSAYVKNINNTSACPVFADYLSKHIFSSISSANTFLPGISHILPLSFINLNLILKPIVTIQTSAHSTIVISN